MGRNNKNIIVVLGGGLVKDQKTGKWRTRTFNEDGIFGATGDMIRVVAASYLYKDNPNNMIVSMSGKGTLKDVLPNEVTVASVMRDELITLGVPKKSIILEDKSGTTFENLVELKKIIRKLRPKKVTLITNDYHLPRVRAMIDYIDELKDVTKMTDIEFASAEKVAIEHDKEKWRYIIDTSYKTDAMQTRIANELKGVQDIKNGTYDFY
jgi:hypothetical protein